MWPEVRDALREARGTIGTIRRIDGPEDQLQIRIQNADQMAAAMEIVRGLARQVVSLSYPGATDITVSAQGDVLTVQLSEAERELSDQRTVQQSLEIIRRRVDEVGTREPTIQRQGADRIIIQVPGIGSAQELKDLIGTTAKLTFHPVVQRTSNENASGEGRTITLPSIDPQDEGTYYVLEESPVVSGEELVDAQPDFDQNGQPAVNFRFNSSGARKFGDYTAENVGSLFAIVLDGEVISAPVIRQHIPGGTGIISGNFTVQESSDLAVLLRGGRAARRHGLPAGAGRSGRNSAPTASDAGTLACIVAFIAVLAFMWASYGLFGLFANVALLINVGLIFGLLSVIGGTLTLPGIAGIVLTIGMAVDANVLVFERIREEMKTAKGPSRAIELGYQKALSAIIDANITTFITAAILFTLGSGPVRGFSVTLALGILTSVFTAIYVTRLLIVTWYERARPKTIEV